MSLKFLIFLLLLSGSALAGKICEDSYCEEYPDYPLELLDSLELWKYKFPEQKIDEQKRHKRDEKDANEFLVETKLCESRIKFVKPQILNNAQNRSKVVINHANFTQFVRIEECISTNFPCTWDVYPNTVESYCRQNYITIGLWSLNDRNNSLVKEKFYVPSSCDCIINKENFLQGVRKSLLERP